MNNESDSDAYIEYTLGPVKLVAIMILVLPGYGLYSAFTRSVNLLSIVVDTDLLYAYSAYIALMATCIAFSPGKGYISISPAFRNSLQRNNAHTLILAVFSFGVVFWLAGRHILMGTMDRGDVLVSLGLAGPFYAFVIRYLLPSIALVAVLNMRVADQFTVSSTVALIIVLLAAFLTGFKSFFIMVLLPAACLMWPVLSVTHRFALYLASFVLMCLSAVWFSNADAGASSASEFVLDRATTVAAFGLACCWDYSAEHGTMSLAHQSIYHVFGSHLSHAVFDACHIRNPGSAHRIITLQYWPDQARADDGSVQLTLTLFGDAVLFFGRWWFVMVLAIGLAFRALCKSIQTFMTQGNIKLGLLGILFITMTVLPVLNTGAICAVLSLPTLAYYSVVYIFIAFMCTQAPTLKRSPHFAENEEQ